MSAICIVHPDDPDQIVFQVPNVRAPYTFADVYGADGYVLVPDCPPVPQERGGDVPAMPDSLQRIVESDRVDNG